MRGPSTILFYRVPTCGVGCLYGLMGLSTPAMSITNQRWLLGTLMQSILAISGQVKNIQQYEQHTLLPAEAQYHRAIVAPSFEDVNEKS